MNVVSFAKQSSIAILIGICTFTSCLQAEHIKAFKDQERVAFSELKHYLPHLQKLAHATTDKQALSNIEAIITYSKRVIKAGPNKAKSRRVKKALHGTLKAIDYLKHKQKSRSSSHSAPDLETVVSQRFGQINTEMQGIVDLVKENATAALPFAITTVPYTITKPGKYYVPRNLTYKGSQAAITISSDNVILNFYNNSLTLTNPAATGILANGVKEFTLENGVIQGTSANPAISFTNVHKALVRNFFTATSKKGIQIATSSGVRVENAFLNLSGISINASSSITIDSCSFTGANTAALNALSIQGATEHVSVSNSTFSNWQNSISAGQVTGLLLEDCLLTGSSGTLLTLGSATAKANSVQIRNTTFVQEAIAPGVDAILFLNGSGCLLESVIVDAATAHSPSYKAGAIHIGSTTNGLLSYDNIVATNCLIKGANEYGLYIENGTHCSCINCQFTDATVANVVLDGAIDAQNTSISGATGCLIKGCKISDSAGSGVAINSGASVNAIVNCEISNNGQNGLTIQQYALKNHIIKNNVFDNANYGIANDEATTATFSNIACNNAVADCPDGGVNPEQAPGVAAVVPGSNVCCVP